MGCGLRPACPTPWGWWLVQHQGDNPWTRLPLPPPFADPWYNTTPTKTLYVNITLPSTYLGQSKLPWVFNEKRYYSLLLASTSTESSQSLFVLYWNSSIFITIYYLALAHVMGLAGVVLTSSLAYLYDNHSSLPWPGMCHGSGRCGADSVTVFIFTMMAVPTLPCHVIVFWQAWCW